MASPEPTTWSLIHTERSALADDLTNLTDDQWTTPSLCDGLTVREVLAHLTAGASLNPIRWMAGVIRCRFDFDKMVTRRLTEHLGATPTDTLTGFRQVITSKTKAPILVLAVLGEIIVHGEDIRHPLGIHRDHPITTLTKVAEYYQGSDQVVPAKKRIAGLQLKATDSAFATGSGPLVSGTTLALIMAMTGRKRDDLDGDGAATLRSRS
jgi:uncharacterized protein (TIGR03083 family)